MTAAVFAWAPRQSLTQPCPGDRELNTISSIADQRTANLSGIHSSSRVRATAATVAARANVSRVAVSRAFNPHTLLKPAKPELILPIAKALA